MTNNGKPCCAWCGAVLVESAWNLEVNMLYCTASGCERFRFPQMKRYIVEGEDEGRLEVSRWILAGRRENWH
jgi:hypothetical protein